MKFSAVTPLWQDRPALENIEVAINADRLGFEELWIGEMATFDAFALATSIAHQTDNISLTVGPLAVAVRTPMNMAMGVASVAELGARQVNLALGASSTVVVEQWHGRQRKHTAQQLEECAQISRGLLAGEKMDFDGEMSSCNGYRLRLPSHSGQLTIAAFGSSAVHVAARQADRMVLNMVTPASLMRLKQQLEEASRQAGRTPPSVAVWLTVAVDPQRQDYDQLLRAVVGYLAAPGYSEMMAEAGFSELVQFAKSGPHPRELLAAMPDELIAAVGLIGSKSETLTRIDAYRDAGADEICLVPATASDPGGAKNLQTMRSLSP